MNTKRRAIRQGFMGRERIGIKDISDEKDMLCTPKKNITKPTNKTRYEYYQKSKLTKLRIVNKIRWY